MAANFPNSPTVGETTTIEGIRYQWTGSEWIISTGRVASAVSQSDNGAIDLSKGSWHKVLVDPDNLTVPVDFSNFHSGSSRWFVEFEISAPADGYDLANASYDNVSFSVAAQESFPYGIHFRPDGTRMYIAGQSEIYSYTLGTAWNITTASYDNVSFDVSAQDAALRSIHFKPDGTKMYMVGNNTDIVYQYTLSTAWDISTASYDNVSFSVAAQESFPYGIHFRPDGTRMYIAGQSEIYSYTLGTAWNITTASYDNVSFDVSAQDGNPRGIHFKPDGTKMYMVGNSTTAVYQYTTGTAYNISITWPSNIVWEANTPPTISSEQNLILEFYTPDGGNTIYGIESINIDNTV